jgi:hypothetical protein
MKLDFFYAFLDGTSWLLHLRNRPAKPSLAQNRSECITMSAIGFSIKIERDCLGFSERPLAQETPFYRLRSAETFPRLNGRQVLNRIFKALVTPMIKASTGSPPLRIWCPPARLSETFQLELAVCTSLVYRNENFFRVPRSPSPINVGASESLHRDMPAHSG